MLNNYFKADNLKTGQKDCGYNVEVKTEEYGKSRSYSKCTIAGIEFDPNSYLRDADKNKYYISSISIANNTKVHESTDVTITLMLKTYNMQVEVE